MPPREGERPRLEVADAYDAGVGGGGIRLELDPPLAASAAAPDADGGASVHGGAAAGPPTLELASGARLQALVADRELTVMGLGGLRAVSGAGGLGAGALQRVLCLAPAARSALPGGPPGASSGLGSGAPEEGASTVVHLAVDVGALDVSVVDQRPQELLAITVAGAALRYGAGLGAGGGFSRLRLAVDSVQVDDQMVGSRFPVVLCPVPGSEAAGPLVQLTLVSQAGGPRGRIYFPYIAFRVTRPLQARVFILGLGWGFNRERGRIYFPYIAFCVTRPLQARVFILGLGWVLIAGAGASTSPTSPSASRARCRRAPAQVIRTSLVTEQ